MRTRVTLALFISLLLVLGASWQRAGKEKAVFKISAETAEINSDYIAAEPSSIADLGNPSGDPKNKEGLTTTDLVSRQLLTDYFNLASAGQATQKNIEALATQYADNLPSLSQVSKISVLELKIVPDNLFNIENYSSILEDIIASHDEDAGEVLDSIANVSAIGGEMYSSALSLSSQFNIVAEKMRVMSVPKSLSLLHIDLINNYRLTAEGFRQMSLVDEDPALAFAGAVSVAESVNSGQTILNEIGRIISSYEI